MIDFKTLQEQSYKGNIGIMELVDFHKKATTEQKKQLESFLKAGKTDAAWDLIEKVSGTKLVR